MILLFGADRPSGGARAQVVIVVIHICLHTRAMLAALGSPPPRPPSPLPNQPANDEDDGACGMLKFVERLLGGLKSKHDDDSVDRANNIWTPILFASFAILMAAKQYVGEPLQCWAPAEFKGHWEKYAESLCFVENTYWMDLHEKFPPEHERRSRQLNYYQWASTYFYCLYLHVILQIVFAMVGEMILFAAPKWVFTWMSDTRLGLAIRVIIASAAIVKKEKKNMKLKDDSEVARVGERFKMMLDVKKRRVERIKEPHVMIATPTEKPHLEHSYRREEFADFRAQLSKCYMTNLYLIYKLGNFVNVIVQLYLLDLFLGTNHSPWGYEMTKDLYYGRTWETSHRFPRVTFCDVDIRDIGHNVDRYTVQCTLMLNMFNEKVFMFLWFWLCGLAIVTLINLFYWLYITYVDSPQIAYIKKRLRYKGVTPNNVNVKFFIDHCLFADGVTALRLIEANSGELQAIEMLHCIWIQNQKMIEQQTSTLTSSTCTASTSNDSYDSGADFAHFTSPTMV